MRHGILSTFRGATLVTLSIMAFAPGAAAENRSIDGSGNNLTPGLESLGSAGTNLRRATPFGYVDDGTTLAGAARPGPREISNSVFAQSAPIQNNRGLSAFVWQWGQFLDHDIDITPDNPSDPAPIAVPTGDAFFDPFSTGTQTIGFNRSTFEQGVIREQKNEITHWIDGSSVYGSDQQRADWLREGDGGRLRVTADAAGDLLPFNDGTQGNAGGPSTDLFVAGDVRANEQVGLTAMHTLFVREHNRRADQFATMFPSWSDEDLYQYSRKVVGAEIQAITYNEFLPALLGEGALTDYTGYDAGADPSIMNVFSTAAYRLGHSMLQPELARLDENRNEIAAGGLELRDAFFNPGAIVDEGGIDPILRGLAETIQQETDAKVIDDVRNFLFGPPGAGGFDLVSLNIQRGRDHGLADYNTVRVAFGLEPVMDFDGITSDAALAADLASVYLSVDDIDPWVGMLAEDLVSGASVGLTIYEILTMQFELLRDGDRFWFENDPMLGWMLDDIHSTRLSDIIAANTGIESIPGNVFFVPEPVGILALTCVSFFLARRRRS